MPVTLAPPTPSPKANGRHKPSHRSRLLVVALVSLVLGIGASASDAAGGGFGEDPWLRALSGVLNAGFVWAGLAVWAGWMVRSRLWVLAGPISLGAALVSYYAYGLLYGDRTHVGISALIAALTLWGAFGLIAGVALARCGHRSIGSGWLARLCRLVVPVGAITEMVLLREATNLAAWSVEPELLITKLAIVAVSTLAIIWLLAKPARR